MKPLLALCGPRSLASTVDRIGDGRECAVGDGEGESAWGGTGIWVRDVGDGVVSSVAGSGVDGSCVGVNDQAGGAHEASVSRRYRIGNHR